MRVYVSIIGMILIIWFMVRFNRWTTKNDYDLLRFPYKPYLWFNGLVYGAIFYGGMWLLLKLENSLNIH